MANKICVIETTVGKKPNGFEINEAEARQWMEEHMNPLLTRCGTLPGCRSCELIETPEAFGEAVATVARRTAPVLAESNLA